MKKAELKALGKEVAEHKANLPEGSPLRGMFQQVLAGIDATLHATSGESDPAPVNCRQIEAQFETAKDAAHRAKHPGTKKTPKKSGGKKNGKKAGGKKNGKKAASKRRR